MLYIDTTPSQHVKPVEIPVRNAQKNSYTTRNEMAELLGNFPYDDKLMPSQNLVRFLASGGHLPSSRPIVLRFPELSTEGLMGNLYFDRNVTIETRITDCDMITFFSGHVTLAAHGAVAGQMSEFAFCQVDAQFSKTASVELYDPTIQTTDIFARTFACYHKLETWAGVEDFCRRNEKPTHLHGGRDLNISTTSLVRQRQTIPAQYPNRPMIVLDIRSEIYQTQVMTHPLQNGKPASIGRTNQYTFQGEEPNRAVKQSIDLSEETHLQGVVLRVGSSVSLNLNGLPVITYEQLSFTDKAFLEQYLNLRRISLDKWAPYRRPSH